MENNRNNGNGTEKGSEFKKFLTLRMIGGVVIIVVVLWALGVILGFVEGPGTNGKQAMQADVSQSNDHASDGAASHEKTGHKADTAVRSHAADAPVQAPADTKDHADHPTEDAHAKSDHQAAQSGKAHQKTTPVHEEKAEDRTHGDKPAGIHSVAKTAHKAQGVGFVEAGIRPLKYELEERRWGWRPNDILNFTDNVNNYQLGVLEVTRRTAVALAERISRTGTADAYNRHLELAMNWFMIKADRYWFPSPESKYRSGLDELEKYMENLKSKEARFYIRTDNLIPLLGSFEDLLGSCDENLVKEFEADGSPVSWFTADDYFYYTKGVANSMVTVLEAVHHEFLSTLESRHATELLHHAIEACKRAAEMEPWIVMDRNLSSFVANHRANMAAPISHARFYIGAVIKTLST